MLISDVIFTRAINKLPWPEKKPASGSPAWPQEACSHGCSVLRQLRGLLGAPRPLRLSYPWKELSNCHPTNSTAAHCSSLNVAHFLRYGI